MVVRYPMVSRPHVLICCGGSGGHFFPGLALANAISAFGGRSTLCISSAPVDKRLVTATRPIHQILALPVCRPTLRLFGAACKGLYRSWSILTNYFRSTDVSIVLNTGGFTGLIPALIALLHRVPVCVFEANAIAGRANRLISHWAKMGWVYFPEAANQLHCCRIVSCGFPTRLSKEALVPRDVARQRYGLDAKLHTILVVGGSNGALRLNLLMLESIGVLMRKLGPFQVIHSVGASQQTALKERLASEYRAFGIRCYVSEFIEDMHVALSAADVVVSRAGACWLSELAVAAVPALLVPLPGLARDHQVVNAKAFARSGAAEWVHQQELTPELLACRLADLLFNEAKRERMKEALKAWHRVGAAEQIAREVLSLGP